VKQRSEPVYGPMRHGMDFNYSLVFYLFVDMCSFVSDWLRRLGALH